MSYILTDVLTDDLTDVLRDSTTPLLFSLFSPLSGDYRNRINEGGREKLSEIVEESKFCAKVDDNNYDDNYNDDDDNRQQQ